MVFLLKKRGVNIEKINCQIISILLNDNNECANKYTGFINGNFNFDNIVDDYFKNKGMKAIKVDRKNQSVCFTNANDKITFFNQKNRKNESYYEEIHIHCNDLYHFDKFVDLLSKSELNHFISEVDVIPHFNFVKNDLSKSELVMVPMTNEVSATKSLLTLLSQRSDETIFRTIAIHFGKLVNNINEVDSELIHKLNKIYQDYVVDDKNVFFSSKVSDKIIGINRDEKEYSTIITKAPSENIDIEDNQYDIFIDSEGFENRY